MMKPQAGEIQGSSPHLLFPSGIKVEGRKEERLHKGERVTYQGHLTDNHPRGRGPRGGGDSNEADDVQGRSQKWRNIQRKNHTTSVQTDKGYMNRSEKIGESDWKTNRQRLKRTRREGEIEKGGRDGKSVGPASSHPFLLFWNIHIPSLNQEHF